MHTKPLLIKALMNLIGAFFIVSTAQAQQDTSVPAQSKAPLAAIKALDNLTGKWRLVVDMTFDNGKTWQSSPPTIVSIETRHKGLMIAEYPQDLTSPGFHMETYITYDQYRNVYRKAAIDDVWGIMGLI